MYNDVQSSNFKDHMMHCNIFLFSHASQINQESDKFINNNITPQENYKIHTF